MGVVKTQLRGNGRHGSTLICEPLFVETVRTKRNEGNETNGTKLYRLL